MRPGPTARPGLVYSLTLHPEPQGPAARTPARRGPAPAPRPRPAPPPAPAHCGARAPPVGPPGLPSHVCCLAPIPQTQECEVLQPEPDGFQGGFVMGQEGLSGSLPELLISSRRPYLEVAHLYRLATSHVSLQHLKPTLNIFILIPHTYQILPNTRLRALNYPSCFIYT